LALSIPDLRRFPVPLFEGDHSGSSTSSYGTLATELALAFLLGAALRLYVWRPGCDEHIWIEYSMNIPLFSF